MDNTTLIQIKARAARAMLAVAQRRGPRADGLMGLICGPDGAVERQEIIRIMCGETLPLIECGYRDLRTGLFGYFGVGFGTEGLDLANRRLNKRVEELAAA